MKTIEFDQQCAECGGTGLYVGMAERDGASVVCHRCKGTGMFHFTHTYEEFTGRKITPKVIRVYKTNPGIMIGASQGHTLEEFGGLSYKDWTEGKKFEIGTENRKYTCPAWWYQSADYDKKPDWNECGFGSFSSCKSFGTKDQCWNKFDRENK